MAEKSSGRFTPKKSDTPLIGGSSSKDTASKDTGSKDTSKASADAGPAYQQSGRYTPPSARARSDAELAASMESPPWVAWLMFVFFGLGLIIIVLNYMFTFLPDSPSNWYLLGGLGAIIAGFITATRLK
jgi:Cell division protein CrgA